MIKEDVYRLFEQQVNEWELAVSNYHALKQAEIKSFTLNGSLYKIQFNPARITSSSAKTDDRSIRERKCFLCTEHLPAEQKSIPFKERYSILVNPYPIFPFHLTIPDRSHTPQRILTRFDDMLDLSRELDDSIVFYNGPRTGASAPDHFHFQAGNKGFLPIEESWKSGRVNTIATYKGATVGQLDETPRVTLLIEAGGKEEAITLFRAVYDAMEQQADNEEPMMNLLACYENGKWIICIFPREKHRPSCYFEEGEAGMLVSPGAVDMGGVFITPRERDFNKITPNVLEQIIKEVCITPAGTHKLSKQIKERL